jgi:hypothetical protein
MSARIAIALSSKEGGFMRNWVGIASAEHVQRGLKDGFMQVCHGKAGPLRLISQGDRVAYYSPTITFGGQDRCQSFTAIGKARDARVYSFDMGGGFLPYRRDVDWVEARPAPIQPLLSLLDLTRGKSNWGYAFRFGLLEISAADMDAIAEAMEARGLAA